MFLRLFITTFCVSLIVLDIGAQEVVGKINIFRGSTTKARGKEAVATFGEGCFWHTEIVFQGLTGVRDAVSGYAGGTSSHPRYEEVTKGRTGHAETVNVFYDPVKISFETLVKAFFASHNPTQLNRQGNDVGSQYRSIAFYRNADEERIIQTEIRKLNDTKIYSGKVVTEVKAFSKFFPAEEYHQEYIIQHPENPYVRNVSIKDYEIFRRSFKGKFKK